METFFHSLIWRDILIEQFKYQPAYLTIENSYLPAFILKLGYLKTLASLPLSDYGGPVINNDGDCVKLYQALIDYSKRHGIAYIRMCLSDPLLIRLFSPLADSVELSKGVMEFDLEAGSSNYVFSHEFSSSTRNKLRRIENSDLQAYTASSESELARFYATYVINTQQHFSNVPFPYSFLKTMWRHLYPDNLRLWIIGKNKPVGGALILKNRHMSHAYLIGIDRMQAPKFSIMKYLAWKEMIEAENEGIKIFSLGSTPSDPTEQHHKVKKDIGATFIQQQTVWIPMSPSGHAALIVRKNTENLWRRNRDFLPKKVRWQFETRMGKV